MSNKLPAKNGLLFKIADKRKNRICFLIFSFLSIAVMVVIFLFSNQTAITSAGLSDNLVESIIPEEEDARAVKVIIMGIFIRKFAHFVLFSSLGFCLTATAINVKCATSKAKLLSVAVVGLIYSVFDEIHQIFMDGRSCEFTDVLLDFGGVLVGMCIFLLGYKFLCFLRSKNKNM